MKNRRALIFSLLLSIGTALAAPQEVDKIVAVVNNSVVLQSDITKLSQSVKHNAQQTQQQLPDAAALHHQILERLIMDSILLQMAQKIGITVTDADLEKAIAGIAAQNQLSLEQMRASMAVEGIGYDDYRAQIRKEMLTSEVRNNEVRRRIHILPQEVAALAREMASQESDDTELNLSQIFLPLPEHPSQQQIDNTENLAKKLITELKAGEDFAKLAATYSADAQALQGGKMGWSKLQELPEVFTEQLQSASKGDVKGPVRSGAGFHILKINEIRGTDKSGVTQQEQAHRILFSRKFAEEAQIWMQEQRAAAWVKILDAHHEQ